MNTVSKWYVVLRWQADKGVPAIAVQVHECRDVLHGRELLTELRELAADLEQSGLLCGLSAEGYEVQELVLSE